MDTNKKNKSLYLSKSICIIHISNDTAILNQCNMVTVSANVKKVDKWLKCQVNVGKIQRQLPFVYGNDFFDGQILIYACSIKHLRSGDTQVFLDFQMCLM